MGFNFVDPHFLIPVLSKMSDTTTRNHVKYDVPGITQTFQNTKKWRAFHDNLNALNVTFHDLIVAQMVKDGAATAESSRLQHTDLATTHFQSAFVTRSSVNCFVIYHSCIGSSSFQRREAGEAEEAAKATYETIRKTAVL